MPESNPFTYAQSVLMGQPAPHIWKRRVARKIGPQVSQQRRGHLWTV